MAKPKTPGAPDPKKPPKAQKGAKAAPPAPEKVYDLPAVQVFQGLPNYGNFPRTEEGLQTYLLRGGMPQDVMDNFLTNPGPLELTTLQSWVNDPANKFRFAGDQPQGVEGASTETDAVSGEARKPGEKKKKKGPSVYVTDPDNMEAKIAAAVRGAGVGGKITKMTTVQGAKGQWKHIVEFQNADGTTGTMQVDADSPASAPADATAQKGKKSKKTAPQQPPAKPAPMTFDERVAAKTQSYKDADKNPPPWMVPQQAVAHGAAAVGRHFSRNSPTYLGGAVGLTATGLGIAGARALMGGGQQPQQPQPQMSQQDIDRLNRSSMEMFGIPYKPSFQAPQPQTQPQPQSAPSQIPAGMPTDDQTTLLLRLAKSRSV